MSKDTTIGNYGLNEGLECLCLANFFQLTCDMCFLPLQELRDSWMAWRQLFPHLDGWLEGVSDVDEHKGLETA